MKNKLHTFQQQSLALAVLVIIMLCPGLGWGQFTPGNLAILRVGTGSAALTSTSAAIFIDEYNTSGTLVQSVAIPTSGINRLTNSGSATSEGQITLSPDGQYLTLAGYDTIPGISGIVSTTAANVNRKLLRVDNVVNYIPVLSSTAYSGNNIRGGVTTGTDFWASGTSGTSGGVQYFGTGTPVQVSTTVTNVRVINIFNGQLFFSTGSGTIGIYAVGTGLPITTGQLSTSVVATGTGASPYAFAFNSTTDICYIADDRTTAAGGIQKWTKSGTTWSLSYTLSIGSGAGARGLTVNWSGTYPVLYAITTANKLVTITDAGSGSPATVLATAGTNTAFRGVAFTPVSASGSAPTLTTQAVSSIGTISATGNGTITATGGVNPTSRGFCWDLATNADPDTNDTKVIETGNFSTGPFTGNIAGLTPGTQYKVRAFATNSVGTGYGSTVYFFTLSGEPTSHAGSFTATAVSQTQIDLTFSAAGTNAAGYLILQKSGSAPAGAPVDGTGYVAGNPIGDGTVAAIVNSTSATVANIIGLTASTHYYFTIFPYNWDGANAGTYNYKTDGVVPGADATTLSSNDVDSYVDAPATQVNPQLVSSLADTDPEAVEVFKFNINDVGSDGLQTKVTQVTITAGGNNKADWPNAIQGAKLSINGGSSFVTTGTPVITTSSIVFPVTSGNLNIANGSNATVSLFIYLKSSGLIDNKVFEFDIPTSPHGFTADATGSTFSATFANAVTSNQMSIDVVATKLKFIQQPTNTIINITMTPAVTIETIDANNNRDLDKEGSVSVESSGTMTEPVNAPLTAGFGTFSSIVHTAPGTGLVLTASFLGLPDVVSSTFIITLVPYLTELVVPKYIGSKTAAGTNNARTPVAFCIQIDELLPSTAYDVQIGLGLTTDVSTSFGAGNIWSGTAFSGSKITNAFTTNASGSSGPVWAFFQPTGNASRFDGGQVHNLRIGYAITGASMASVPNFVGAKQITALDIANVARTTATTDDGAFIKGSADPSVTGKYVLLYDNVAGTGDPLFSYQIRQATATNTHQSEIPNPVDSVYMQSGNSAIGDYPAVVPIGANNPNGVQRVEARNADNTINFYNSDADGIWPSGVNTTTLARRDVGIITVNDAPLVVTNKTLNMIVYLEGLYNLFSGKMNQAQGLVPPLGSGIADKITVELHDGTSPYNVAHTFSNVNLNTDGTLSIPTVPSDANGSYYIVIKHRNSIEVWSSTPISFSGTTIAYDFASASTQAYGSVLKNLGGVYGLYLGDVNQDGIVDSGDMIAADNDAANFASGYLAGDVNGDGIVNTDDVLLIKTNTSGFVAKMKP